LREGFFENELLERESLKRSSLREGP